MRRGGIWFQATKTPTTTRFTPNVIAAASVIEVGITSRGNESLRSSDSRATIEDMPRFVASAKNVKSTMPIRRASG